MLQQLGKLRLSRDFEPQVFRKAVADFSRQTIVHPARAQHSDIDDGHGSRSSHGDYKPYQGRKGEAGKRSHLKPESVPRSKIADHCKRHQEHSRGNGCKHDEGYVDDAVQALPGAAMLTGREMLLVVAAHLRRNPGNVVAPARKNFSHQGIDALLAHIKELQPDWLHGLRLQCQHHAVMKQGPASP
jgi:hypothetical protein